MVKWLEKIQGPQDIRGLNIDQLREIAEEIREEILSVTARNGGHLASSMGAVELTLALHYVFDTPGDRLVWDVGHQGYAHKLITGRAARFGTIRQEGGLSGFLKRGESPYDAFGAGHASTAISAAIGMAVARDRLGKDYHVVSITGDGAMSGGLCYEALNNAGHLQTDLLMVLNDNEMSISRNVGALSHYFNRLVTTDIYTKKRKEVLDLMRRLPAGEKMLNLTSRIEESIKGLIVPGLFFEELGIRYLGPVDGHDLEQLIQTLRKVRDLKGPILLHTLTTKGKGRPYAEQDPVLWHSPPLNFDADSGKAPFKKPGPPSFTEIFVDALREAARSDGRIVALTAAMLEGTGLVKFQEEFPERTYDVGIAEGHAVVKAAGMACDGLRPFVCIYSSFMQRAIDMIMHDVALQDLPVVFSLDRAGLVGADGATHHGVFDLTFLRMIPNLIIMAPRNGTELRDMTHTSAVYDGNCPIAIRFPRSADATRLDTSIPPATLEIGKGQWLRHGQEVCLVGIGNMANHALEAAAILEHEGIQAGVIDARFVKPLDRDMLLEAANRYPCLVTIEDNAIAGGFGSAVLELMAAEGLSPRVVTLGIPDRFIEHATQQSLYRQLGLSPEAIAAKARELVQTGRTGQNGKAAGMAPVPARAHRVR